MATLSTTYQLLAESDYYTFLSDYNGKVCIRLYAKYNNQDISGLTSSVGIKLTKNLTGTSSSVHYSCYQKTASLDGDLSHSYSNSDYATFNALSEYVIFEETFTVTHDDDGRKSLELSASYDDSYISPLTTGWVSCDLPTIPRQATITSAKNFTDEENPTITYANLAGDAVTELKAFIYAEDDSTVLVDGQGLRTDATSFTFILTDEMRETLRKAAANSNSITVRPYVFTSLAGKEYWSGTTATMTIVNADPALTVSVVDTNEETIALTGDEKTLVKFHSDAKATMSAEALKGATIDESKYVIGCGGVEVNATEHTFKEADYNKFIFSATDSRGNVGEEEIEIDMIPYKKLTCIMSNNKPDADGNMTVACKGAYFQGSFGAVDNTLTVQYRYSKLGSIGTSAPTTVEELNNLFASLGLGGYEAVEEDGKFVLYYNDTEIKTSDTVEGLYGEISGGLGQGCDWTDMEVSITDDRYYAYADITGLDYKTTYTFECRAIDKLAEESTGQHNIRSLPVYHWGSDDFVHESPVIFNDPISGDGLKEGLSACLDEIMGDYVVEAGIEPMDDNGYVGTLTNSGFWFWRKWKSGRADCYGRSDFGQVDMGTEYGNMYGASVGHQTYPSGLFIAAPEYVSIEPCMGGAVFSSMSFVDHTAEQTGEIILLSPSSGTYYSSYLGFNVIGRWKY